MEVCGGGGTMDEMCVVGLWRCVVMVGLWMRCVIPVVVESCLLLCLELASLFLFHKLHPRSEDL